MYRSARGFPHEWSERDPDQQSFWIEEAADGLTPGFFLVLHEHAMSARFELRFAYAHDHFLMRNLPIKLRFPRGTPFQRRMS